MAIEYVCDYCGKRQVGEMDMSASISTWDNTRSRGMGWRELNFCSTTCLRSFLIDDKKMTDLGVNLAVEIDNDKAPVVEQNDGVLR